MKRFDLNIEQMLENWTPAHAIREVIANALDEQKLTNSAQIEIRQTSPENWSIRDYGRGINHFNFTQNENPEKLVHPHLTGKFGVGLKDALATFDRNGIRISILSKNGDFTIERAEKHNFSDLKTLHVCVAPPSEPELVGTEFMLYQCAAHHIEAAKQFFLTFADRRILEATEYGEIVASDDETRGIYINGVRVAIEENFLFSYNITSLTASIKRALNRERTNVGRSAYADRVKSILLASKSKEIAEQLISDLRKYEVGTGHDELKWIDVATHVTRLLSSVSAQRTVFVTPSELLTNARYIEDAKRAEYEIVTIPEIVRERISGQLDQSGEVIVDVQQLQASWNQSFEFDFVGVKDLQEDELNVYLQTPKILSIVGGLPSQITGIKISNTMRRDFTFDEVVGLCDPANHMIIIKRSQLSNIELYAGTLLHEVAHAISRSPDISRDFEISLTQLLGKLGAHLISVTKRGA